MAKKVIIAEKPSVAMEFVKALKQNINRKNGYIESEEYIFTWCVGHLVTMSYPEVYDEKLKYWNLSTLPFIPKEYKYEVIEDVKNQFEIVKNILTREDVDTIYVATDSGREGEYIYRLVDNMANVQNKEKKRIWIDSQTEEAIIEGIQNAKDISFYDSLSDAAYLRAKEDYLMGINFSRLLSIIYGKELAKKLDEKKVVISIGRVMTCVLGMITQREIEIRNFKKQNFYKLQGKFNKNGEEIILDYKVNEKSKYFESPKMYNDTGFNKLEDAEELRNDLLNSEGNFKIIEVSKKKQKENAPLLYNLAELQNECSKKFKINPDETLKVAQNLYEKKLTTYPRTDARVLSSAVAKVITKNLNGITKGYKNDEVKDYLNIMISNKYNTNLVKTKYVDDSKITDHYAIIPTGSGYENLDKLTTLEKDIYQMIVKRFLAIFFPPAVYNKISLTVEKNNEIFTSSIRSLEDAGFQIVLKDNINKKEDTDGKISQNIVKLLKKGEEVSLDDIEIKTSETTPPKRYNSGSIILAMENAGKLIEDDLLREQIKGSGIGTSATRAGIITKLQRIGYIALNKKTQILTPTVKGEEVYNIVKKSMPDLLNPELTASWEKGLSLVAESKITKEEFMNKLERYVNKKVSIFKNNPRFMWYN